MLAAASPVSSWNHRRSSRRLPFDTSSRKTSKVGCTIDGHSFQNVGMEQAAAAERQRLFNRIAPMYDNLNDVLSLGQHRVWKRMAVTWSGAKAGDSVLDICCGSGDLSLLLAERVGPGGNVVGLDFAAEQLALAKQRQDNSFNKQNIRWCLGDALNLPFEAETFDAITMGYGLRNVTDIPKAFREILRVLKPGSSASILDFNRSTNLVTTSIQSWILDNVVVPVASSFGVTEDYEYLKESIAKFPTGKRLENLALESGFKSAVHYEMAAGLMGVLVIN